MEDKLIKHPFYLPDVPLGPFSYEIDDLLWDIGAFFLEFSFNDGYPGFVVWVSYITDHSALKTTSKPLLEYWNGLRRPVGGYYYLLIGFIKGVKGMEKLLFGLFFAADELDIVDYKHVNEPVGGLNILHAPVANGPNDVIGEFFGSDVLNFYFFIGAGGYFVADSLY